MKYPKQRLFRLLALVLGVVTATVLAIVILVYQQVSSELNNQAVESVRTRLASLQGSVFNHLLYAGSSGSSLLRAHSDYGSTLQTAAFDSRINQVVRSSAFVRALLVAFNDGASFSSFEIDPAITINRATDGATRDFSVHSFSDHPYLRNAGGWYLASAYRDTIGLSTLLPVVVYEFVGVERAAVAVVVFDLSELLFDLMAELSIVADGVAVPIVVSIFDSRGRLLETSRNFPIARIAAFNPATTMDMVQMADDTGRRSELGAFVQDARTGLLIYGSVDGPTVLRRAGRLSTQILAIGVLCVAAILVLGVALLGTFERLSRSEQQRAGMRVKVLQATMNPHFLFNTLDTMVGLAYKRDFEGLVATLKALSHQLRGVVRTDSDLATVADEVEYVKSYLDIQRYRYADGFRFTYTIPDDCARLLIPRFCLQPLVENCFAHAIPFVDYPLHIQISATIEAAVLAITVHDNGPGCPEPRLAELRAALREAHQTHGRNVEEAEHANGGVERHGIGLYSVHRRIGLAFGSRYGLTVNNRPAVAVADDAAAAVGVTAGVTVGAEGVAQGVAPGAPATEGGFAVGVRLPCLAATVRE